MYNSENLPKSKTFRSGLINRLINFSYKAGLHRVGRQFWSKSLTVINYHRIEEPFLLGLDSFRPNISGNTLAFSEQLSFIKRTFNTVTVKSVVNWLDGKENLPPYAALLTFDDGYLDNYTHAYPLLCQYNLPAVIFLTSGHIGTDIPFFWDLIAYCFYHTSADHVRFPDGKEMSWTDVTERDQVCKAWIESLKSLPDEEKQLWVDRFPEQMGVSIPPDYFRNLMMNWDQVREMQQSGIEFGGHTLNHPILSRISLAQAQVEIEGSKKQIERELGLPIYSFAYPNGLTDNLNKQIEDLVAKVGFRLAFTLKNGPALLREVKQNPFAIARIFISYKHTLPRFAMETCWINRFRG